MWLASTIHAVASIIGDRFYHGTLKTNIPSILSSGISATTGWGWAGQDGVSLATNRDEALYWAKMQWLIANEMSPEERNFRFVPETDLGVVEVTLPAEEKQRLEPDHDQLEDFGLSGDASWQESAQAMSSVVYPAPIPAAWITR